MLFTQAKNTQIGFELVCIENMVPENHLLRVIDKYIDLSFIIEIVRPYYSETQGRPSIDPIALFKIMLIGYLYGIKSERQLEKEIHLNLAYRWFLGYGFKESVPHHSSISWNRNNRFNGTNIFQEIFDKIVHLAISHRMVAGRLLITDSTHIRANANNNLYTMQEVTGTSQEYAAQLEQAVNEDRIASGKKPLAPSEAEPEVTIHKVSTTDPESGLLVRHGKPEGFHYLDHRTVDHKFNIITDVHVTAGNVNDAIVYIERLKRQIETFGFAATLEAVALDSGYMTPYICFKTEEMDIFAVIAEREAPTTKGIFPKKVFNYDKELDRYICPANQPLSYTTTHRSGYREYKSNSIICKDCPLLLSCTTSNIKQRQILRNIWEESKEKVNRNKQSEEGKAIYKKRKQTIELSFADAKMLHGLRYCRLRGRNKVQEQALMTATAQNLKKIATQLAKRAS